MAVLWRPAAGGGAARRGARGRPQAGSAADAVDGLEVICQKPNTSAKQPGHAIYPYLLRNFEIARPNHVWCADITYIAMAKRFVYLVAIMDWHSRCVLAWRLSITMETDFCVDALEDALHRFGRPDIFNTDQGAIHRGGLHRRAGRTRRADQHGWQGADLDNIFIERLLRSLKYEEVFLKAYACLAQARLGIGAWLTFYNDQRQHQALEYQTPAEVYRGAGATCGHLDKARALTTSPQALLQQEKEDSNRDWKKVDLDRNRLAA